MEQIPPKGKNKEENSSENVSNDENKKIATITEDSEFYIIDTGISKRYVPKWEYIPIHGQNVKCKELVRALALYPHDKPAIALEKFRREHKDVKEK